MERLLIFTLLVSLTCQSPLPQHLSEELGLATGKEEHVQKSIRDAHYYCPFSHPSVLDPNEASPGFYRSERSGPEVPSFLQAILRPKRSVQLKSKYVNHQGQILSYASGNSIRIDATVHVSDYAHTIAAETIKEMTQHMPAYLFNSLASNTKVWVFTKAESLTVFPEYAGLAAPAGCGSSCAGHCHTQCTFDGRPYSTLAGTGGQRGVVVEDNVLCNSQDPYRSQDNILVHEYAHTIKSYGLSSSLKRRITAAYNNAKSHSLWTHQYSMETEDEYWAVGTEAWFNTIHTTYATGGMNVCSGQACSTGLDARWNLYRRDVTLYGLLLEVYFNGDVNVQPGLQSCTKLH